MRRYLLLAVTLPVLILVAFWHDTTPFTEHRVNLEPGFTESPVAQDLTQATSMAFAPDGRLFVTEQLGTVRVIKEGVMLAEPFMRLEVAAREEAGLLHIALDPHFDRNHWVYLYYTTATAPTRDRLIRVTAQGDTALADSQVTLFESDPLPASTTHRGGAIAFDRDNFLYLSVGDANDFNNAQRLDTLFGKVLRLTRDGKPAPNNPFVQQPGARPEIFAYGLRNTFRLSPDATDGAIYMNDVGEADWEEINALTRGANYGWGLCEGKCQTKTDGLTDPVFAYAHKTADLNGCAITGGVFYQPAHPMFPSQYLNRYFYADLCGGWIRSVNLATGNSEPFVTGLTNPVDLKVGPDGALYYLTYGAGRSVYRPTIPGQLWRIEYNAPAK